VEFTVKLSVSMVHYPLQSTITTKADITLIQSESAYSCLQKRQVRGAAQRSRLSAPYSTRVKSHPRGAAVFLDELSRQTDVPSEQLKLFLLGKIQDNAKGLPFSERKSSFHV
jgi:hypothetical protein